MSNVQNALKAYEERKKKEGNIVHQLSPSERMLIIRNIKDGITKCDLEELKPKLTISELKFLGGDAYEIEKSNN